MIFGLEGASLAPCPHTPPPAKVNLRADLLEQRGNFSLRLNEIVPQNQTSPSGSGDWAQALRPPLCVLRGQVAQLEGGNLALGASGDCGHVG